MPRAARQRRSNGACHHAPRLSPGAAISGRLDPDSHDNPILIRNLAIAGAVLILVGFWPIIRPPTLRGLMPHEPVILAEFAAPWSRSLRSATVASVALLIALTITGLFLGPRQSLVWRAALVGVPLAVLLGTAPFAVRGYFLTERHIEVRRLGWRSALPLAGLISVTGVPEGLRGSVRIFGNGGLFGITGWFWNRRIGRFRAYATDPERAVLLRYADGKKLVVTPHDVQHFIVRVKALAKLSGSPAGL